MLYSHIHKLKGKAAIPLRGKGEKRGQGQRRGAYPLSIAIKPVGG